MSTVAALSTWLVHTNRRRNGAWTQRYEHGIPATELVVIPDGETTGTTVQFLPAGDVRAMGDVSPSKLRATANWSHLIVEVIDQRVT
jgi:topoisomerase-4 subunit B